MSACTDAERATIREHLINEHTLASRELSLLIKNSRSDQLPPKIARTQYQWILTQKQIGRHTSQATGDVYLWGQMEQDQLDMRGFVSEEEAVAYEGTNDGPSPLYPRVKPDTRQLPIRQIAAGGQVLAALTTDGKVYTWGSDSEGCLGRHNPVNDENAARQNPMDVIPDMPFITQIVAGNTFILLLDVHGKLWMSGLYRDQKDDKFRHPSTENTLDCLGFWKSPIVIPHMPGFVHRVAASMAGNFAVALVEGGGLVSWGFGQVGELGRVDDSIKPNSDGTYDLDDIHHPNKSTPKPIPEKVMQHFLTPKPVRWGGPIAYPRRIVVDISCGALHMLVAARDRDPNAVNRLYVTGHNAAGQLGLGEDVKARYELTEVPNVKDVSMVTAGEHHSLIVCGSKTLLASGKNREGQCGLGPKVHVVYKFTIVPFPQSQIDKGLVFAQVTAAENSNMVVTTDHRLFSWGVFDEGATGHRTTESGQNEGFIWRPKLLTSVTGNILQVCGAAHFGMALVSDEK